MRRRRTATGVALVALLTVCLGSQSAAAVDTAVLAGRLAESWRWERFGVESGLPSPWVVDVAAADDGTLWAATAQSLAWYDDYTWHPVRGTWRSAGVPQWLAAAGGSQVAIVVDGALFVGDRDGFVEVRVSAGDSVSTRVLAALPFAGRLVALTEAGIHDVRGQTLLYPLPWQVSISDPSRGGRAVLGATRHALWLGTVAGLARVDDAGWSLVMPGVDVTTLTQQAGEVLAVSVAAPLAQRGLWETDGGGPPVRVDDGGGVFPILALAADGAGLAVCEAGHVHLRGSAGWVEAPTGRQVFGQTFRALMDRGGDLWLATEDGLWLARLSDRLWSWWRSGVHGDHDRDRVNALYHDSGGTLWIGGDAGLEARHADGTTERFEEAAGTPLQVLTAVAVDSAGRLWVGSGSSFGGAVRRDADGWRRIGAQQGLTDAPIHRIRADRRGRLWFLSLGDGAWLLDDDRFRRAGPAAVDTVAGTERVYDMAQEDGGAVWLATAGGLWRGIDGIWERWGTDRGLAVDRVFTVAIDDDGRPWFGHGATAPGLGCIDAAGTVRYDLRGADAVHSFVREVRWEADAGGLWLTADDGLWRLGPHGFAHIDAGDGLPSQRLWPVLPVGRRVFVGTRGQGVAVLHLGAAGPPPQVQFLSPSTEGRRVVLTWTTRPARGLQPERQVATRCRVDAGAWSPWSHLRRLELADVEYGAHSYEVEALGRLGETVARQRGAFDVPRPLLQRATVAGPLALLAIAVAALITESWRRRSQFLRGLRASESRFRTLLEGVADAVLIVDTEGRIQQANRTASAMTGVAPESLPGRQVADLLLDAGVDELQRLWRAQAVDAPAVSRERLRNAAGAPQPVELRTIRFRDGDREWLHLSLRDNGAQLKAERQARVRLALERLRNRVVQMAGEADWEGLVGDLERDMHQVLSFHNCSVSIVEGQGGLTQFVEWGAQIERRHLDEVPAPIRTCWEEQRVLYRPSRQDMTAESFDLEEVKVGSVIDIPFSGGTLGVSHGDVDAFDAGAIDTLQQFAQILTEAHRRLEDLRALEAQQAEVQRARRHERLLHLATGVAHEINNPLTQVIGFSELLLRDGSSVDRGRALQSIHDAGRQAAGITQRLLAMAQREEQGPRWLDLHVLLGNAVALVRFSYAARQVRVDLRPAVRPLTVVAAPGDIEDVVLSLMQVCHDELLQHDGGTIIVSAEDHGADAVVRVGTDAAAAAPAPTAVAAAARPQAPGALDLLECRAAIAAAGGRLAVESGAGARAFALYLPLHTTEKAIASGTVPIPTSQQGASA